MTDTLRFGLIGTGWIGRFHAETLATRLPNATLVAVADPNVEAAQSIGAPRAYSDALELIADPSVQAVAISSPASTHTDLVAAAARAGKHVFCEKPMALTLDDADRAIQAADDAAVALQVGFDRRFAPDFIAARDAIVAGSIGTPQMLRSLTRDPGISAESRHASSRGRSSTKHSSTTSTPCVGSTRALASPRCTRRRTPSSIRNTPRADTSTPR